MKISKIETIHEQSEVINSPLYIEKRQSVINAIQQIDWPIGTGKFSIYPESGKKRGQGNGVKAIKIGFLNYLEQEGWTTELRINSSLRRKYGGIDAVFIQDEATIAVEWETGNVSSSHRSLNKLCFFIKKQIIRVGFLVIPCRNLAKYLTDRIGNFEELEPYFEFWQSALESSQGVLEIISIEHDDISYDVPKIPKGTDGRATN
ncbi:MAG: restriction endonuclease [Limnoraphis robusta]|jgi:hypothetical protein